MNTIRENLANNLRRLRGDTTQRVFARKIGIAQASLNRFEQGTQNVTIDTLATICVRLKCKPGDLLDE